MKGKIAVEEHFALPDMVVAQNNGFRPEYLANVQRRLPDRNERLEVMDQCGIEVSLLSLTEPGVQGIPDKKKAIEEAQRVNDHLAEYFVKSNPKRFQGLGVVPMQDPAAAARELERMVKDLGLKGTMINGFSNIGDGEDIMYLDEKPCWEFWAAAEQLGVPISVHPRVPLPSQRRSMKDYDVIRGSLWGFARETCEHAIRLMLSGVFDQYPKALVCLGHLAEGLIFALPRMDKRMRHQQPGTHGDHKRLPTEYFRDNFIISTSGIMHTPAMHNALVEIGADKLIFAVDYPFESSPEIAGWFDSFPINEDDRMKIGRLNAAKYWKIAL